MLAAYAIQTGATGCFTLSADGVKCADLPLVMVKKASRNQFPTPAQAPSELRAAQFGALAGIMPT